MRLRRIEFVFIGLTLAFICFMGGFFVGRNVSSVNLVSVVADGGETHGLQVQVEFEVGDTLDSPQQNAENVDIRETAQDTKVQETQTPSSQSQSERPVEMPRGSEGKININFASQTELTDLPGIGNTIASRIVEYRQQNGEYRSIEDIMKVSGIGERRFDAIRELITVG
ncbi:MAG: helix-hairpin-helix domain-containing protein [Oscillospiraceae bacterium]|nr:helix-hairpin-helix domain-containing protein [Oscillospiraceae bacterium]